MVIGVIVQLNVVQEPRHETCIVLRINIVHPIQNRLKNRIVHSARVDIGILQHGVNAVNHVVEVQKLDRSYVKRIREQAHLFV